jgi:hypothetical protein
MFNSPTPISALFGVLFVLILIAGATFFVVFWLRERSNAAGWSYSKKSETIPPELAQLHNAWLKKAVRWERAYLILTISAVSLSALVATGTLLFPDSVRNWLAVASVIVTGSLTAFNPYKAHEDYIGAWRVLNLAKLDYLVKDDAKLSYLVEQARIAEDGLRDSRRYDPKVEPSTNSKSS